jgi:hypothetical protein
MKMVRCTGCGRIFDWDGKLGDGGFHVTGGATLEDVKEEFWFCGACRPKAEKEFREATKGATWMGNPN